jgi:hypothetical protein
VKQIIYFGIQEGDTQLGFAEQFRNAMFGVQKFQTHDEETKLNDLILYFWEAGNNV